MTRRCDTCDEPLEGNTEGPTCPTCLLVSLSNLGADEEVACDSCGEPCDGDPDQVNFCGDCLGGDDDEEDTWAEPTEDDYVTEDHRHFYQYGKLAVVVDEDEEWAHKVHDHMAKEQFRPNVYFISDHGNAHLIDMLDALREADERTGGDY